MQARMTHPVQILPSAMKALAALSQSSPGKLSDSIHKILELRASQINGCSMCVELHARELKQAGEQDERIWAVAAWRESPHFDDDERAALELTECVTRLADRPDPVPDEVWQRAADRFSEEQLAELLVAIAAINVWNRLNAAIRQPAVAAW